MNTFDDLFDPLDRIAEKNRKRISCSGYPTVVVYSLENGDDDDFVEWWRDDVTNEFDELTTAIRDGEVKMSDAAWRRQLDEVIAHQDRLVEQTIEVLRNTGDLEDLCELIDAAADKDSAVCPEGGGGSFLRVIAKLAMKQIQTESARPAGTGTSAEQNDLFGSHYSSGGAHHG